MKQVTYSKAATRTLRRIPANTARQIVAKVAQYAVDPASLANNVVAMKGSDDGVRLRVADWRVIMIDGAVIEVVKIGPRGGIYE